MRTSWAFPSPVWMDCSFCLSFQSRGSLIFFMTLCWTISSMPMFLLFWEAQSWVRSSTPYVASSVLRRGERSPPLTYWQHFASCTAITICLLCFKGKVQAHVQLRVQQDSSFFSGYMLFSMMALRLYCCIGLFLPRCRYLHFLLNFIRFLSTYFCSLFKLLWMAVQLFAISTATLPCFVSSTNLLRVLSVPSFKSLMKILDMHLCLLDVLFTVSLSF